MIILNESSNFSDWAEMWFKYKCINLSLDYCTATQSQINYLISAFGDVPVCKIRPMDVQAVIANLATLNPHTQKPSSKRTLRGVMNTAKSIFDFVCFNSEYYNKNPASNVTLPANAPQTNRRSLTRKEVEWVVNTPHRGRIAAIIMTFCGLRSGELIPLEWNDIDFENALIHVSKSVKKKDTNAYEIKHGTKNGKTRSVPVPEIILKILQEFKNTATSPYICCQCDESLHTPTSWRKLWESYNNVMSHLYASSQQASRNIYHPLGLGKE